MAPDPHHEKRRNRRSVRIQPLEIRISFSDTSGVQQVMPAYVVDVSDDGLSLQMRRSLPTGTVVNILVPASGLAGSDIRLRPKASVRWCRAQAGGIYRAGLQFEKTAAAPEPKAEAEDDYYEVLQVNPKATADTIHRVYRILAQQYHPDNRETGDESAFRTVTAAYKVLSDPETRVAYDLRYESARSQRWKIFTTPQSVQGVEGERRKRFGVLRALYAKRLQDPRQPEMSIQELESLLGVARDHLEFTLWYLKERAFVSRSDNIRFLITAAGVEQTELLEEAHVAREQIDSSHLLPAAGRPAR